MTINNLKLISDILMTVLALASGFFYFTFPLAVYWHNIAKFTCRPVSNWLTLRTRCTSTRKCLLLLLRGSCSRRLGVEGLLNKSETSGAHSLFNIIYFQFVVAYLLIHLTIIKPWYCVFFGGDVTKYINSSNVLKCSSETLVLYWVFPLDCILQTNILLHYLFDNLSH